MLINRLIIAVVCIKERRRPPNHILIKYMAFHSLCPGNKANKKTESEHLKTRWAAKPLMQPVAGRRSQCWKNKRETQGSLIKELVIIKMQLILIPPPVPPLFVWEISQGKGLWSDKQKLPLSSSLRLLFLSALHFTKCLSWELKCCQEDFLTSVKIDRIVDYFHWLCQHSINERCDVCRLQHNYRQSSIIGCCVLCKQAWLMQSDQWNTSRQLMAAGCCHQSLFRLCGSCCCCCCGFLNAVV